MAFCSSCGTKMDDGAQFCPSCGQPVQVSAFCANCGTQLGGAKFCPSCGTPAGGGASPPHPQSSAVPPPLPQQAAFTQPQQATAKAGNIRKCSACGAAVPSMTAVCPSCGHEFSNMQTASSVQAFFEKIDALEQQELDAEMNAPKKTGLAALFDMSSLGEAFTKRKFSLIAGFPIPNSKEEIMEFLILASSRVKKMRFADSSEDDGLDKAWIAKCKQAYSKAQIVLASDKENLQKVEKIFKDAKIK